MKINGRKVQAEYVHFRVPQALIECNTKMKGKPRDFAPYSKQRHLWNAFTRGGATLCKLFVFDRDGRKFYVGMGKSFCSMSDNFCYRTGRYYAIKDAIKNSRG
jgi:hypothetical protein